MAKKIKALESKDTFKVTFGGDSSIDVELFTKSINDTMELIKASANAINPDCYLRLQIAANTEGSFQTVLNAVVAYSPSLFTTAASGAHLANEIIDGFIDLLSLAKLLKGSRPIKVEHDADDGRNVIVTNINGDNAEVRAEIGTSYFNNANIQNLVINLFGNLREGDRDSFSVSSSGRSISLGRNDYAQISESVPLSEQPDQEIIEQPPAEVILVLKKPDLSGDSQWEFSYTKIIQVKMLDEEFLAKVRRGDITFKGGSKIKCILNIKCQLNERSQVVKEYYTVTKVIGDVIQPAENISMFNGE